MTMMTDESPLNLKISSWFKFKTISLALCSLQILPVSSNRLCRAVLAAADHLFTQPGVHTVGWPGPKIKLNPICRAAGDVSAKPVCKQWSASLTQRKDRSAPVIQMKIKKGWTLEELHKDSNYYELLLSSHLCVWRHKLSYFICSQSIYCTSCLKCHHVLQHSIWIYIPQFKYYM